MARSFAGGVIWGIVVVGMGLAVLSQVSPLPEPASETAATTAQTTGQGASVGQGGAEATDVAKDGAGQAASTPAPATVEATTPKPDVTPQPSAADTAPAPKAVPEQTPPPATDSAAAPASTEQPAAQPSTAGPDAPAASAGAEAAAPATDQAKAAPQTAASPTPAPDQTAPAVPQPAEPPAPAPLTAAAETPGLPDAPATTEALPALSSLDAALTAPSADALPKAAQAPAPDPVGASDALLVPSQGAGLTEPSRLPQIAGAEDPGLAQAPVPVVVPPVPDDSQPKAAAPLAPRVITPDRPSLAPDKGIASTLPTTLAPSVPGVATNALPHVGDTPKADAAAGATTDAAPSDPAPFVKYSRKFVGEGSKPLFAILLHDVGGAGMSRTDLANLPFPVTFVIDPLATDAKEAEAVYRAAGQEVLMLANGLPAGATAGDVAQTFQTLANILPEAVGVIDMETLGFQDNRALATLVLPVIADQGRGLVTYDQGLNAADQIARRDGLPAAVVFRRLDGAGESQVTIRRYLDRAAFKAAQEGSVVVLGDTRADTVAAILQWAIEGKGATMALAPVTAVMGRQ